MKVPVLLYSIVSISAFNGSYSVTVSKSRILKIEIHVHVGDLKPLQLLLFKSMRLLPLFFFLQRF